MERTPAITASRWWRSSFPIAAPPLDRESLRAAVFVGGAWPRTIGAYLERLEEVVGPGPWSWFPDAAAAVQALGLERILSPAWVPADLVRIAEGPASPGAARLWCSATEDLSTLRTLLATAETKVVVDARSAPGAVLDGRPIEALGCPTILWPDLGPGGSAMPGVLLRGGSHGIDGSQGRATGGGTAFSALVGLLWTTARTEPRIVAITQHLPALSTISGARPTGPALAAASVRLAEHRSRSVQRSRVRRTLAAQLRHLPGGVEVDSEPSGCEPSGAWLRLRCEQPAALLTALRKHGVGAAPPPVAVHASTHWPFVDLPVQPYWSPRALAAFAEGVRRSALSLAGP